MKNASSARISWAFSRIKGPILSGIAFFSTVVVLSVGYAAYSALQSVSTASPGSQMLSAEWNKMVSNFVSIDSQLSSLDSAASEASSQISSLSSSLSSLSSQVGGLSVNGGNPWVSGGSGISYSSGNVAIGKAPASASFEVRRSASDSEYAAWFEGAGSGNHGVGANVAGTSSASNVAHFKSGNISRFLVRADGNVGIGTASPGYPLDVTGDVRFTGTLQGGTVPVARVSGLGTLASKSAVAGADITDGTIATADIANYAVTSAKIATGAVTSAELAASAVTSSALASASVTDAKVASGISPSKLASASATSGQVLSWNGSAWTPTTVAGGSSEYSGPRFATLLRDGSFTVPQGVTSMSVRLIGWGGWAGGYYGGGGSGQTCIKRWSTVLTSANGWAGTKNNANAANGARVATTISVTPGETLDIFIGAGGGGWADSSSVVMGAGGGGWGGGGGGYRAGGGWYGGGGGGGANVAGAGWTACGTSWGGGGTYGGGGGTVSGWGAGWYGYGGGGGGWGTSTYGGIGGELAGGGGGTVWYCSPITTGGWSMDGRWGSIRSCYYAESTYYGWNGGDGGLAYISW